MRAIKVGRFATWALASLWVIAAALGCTDDGGGDVPIGGAGGSGVGNSFVSEVEVSVHPKVATVLVVTWDQVVEAEATWLEFTFEDGNVLTSRPKPGTLGKHKDVALGIPGETKVTLRIVNKANGTENKTKAYKGTTDAIPASFPAPEVVSYDPALASHDRYLFGAVEDSEGGDLNGYYRFTFWTFIIDRKGRVVWYYADSETNPTSSFQRLARDGEYIWIDKRAVGGSDPARSVLKMTLDWEYFEDVPVDIADCIDVTDDGSFLYDWRGVLKEQTKDGQIRDIWTCQDEFSESEFHCYSNTVNWNPQEDTIFLSFPSERTVVEIDRTTGKLVGTYGDVEGSYTFSPNTWGFGYQHFPNMTADGTLIVSSHMPGYEDTTKPVPQKHAFIEFVIDRRNRQLVETWHYNEGPEWAGYKGMAIRMPNGNTLANYGTGGVIREITPDKQTAFDVKFNVGDGGGFYNKMVGNTFFIDDLYLMNGGPKR